MVAVHKKALLLGTALGRCYPLLFYKVPGACEQSERTEERKHTVYYVCDRFNKPYASFPPSSKKHTPLKKHTPQARPKAAEKHPARRRGATN